MRCGGPGLCPECSADASRARTALAQHSPASDLDPLNLAPHAEAFNEAPAEALKPEQAEAERPEVVAVMESNGAGGKRLAQRFPIVNVFVGDELMTVAQHERIAASRWERAMDLMGDHVARISDKLTAERDAALAEVERLRQFERICEGLPQDAIDGGWTVQGIRAHSKQLEEQLKVALARVAELEKQEPVAYVLFRDGEVYYETDDNIVISNTPGDETDLYRWLPVFTAPVAQAQHSVPELDQLYSMLGAESQVDAAKKIAELIGCRMSRSALTEAQMRRIYENSTEIENERLGFAAFARLMRRAEAVHQIAAAPGKEGL